MKVQSHRAWCMVVWQACGSLESLVIGVAAKLGECGLGTVRRESDGRSMGRRMRTMVVLARVLVVLALMVVQGPGYVRSEIDNVAFQWSDTLSTILCSEGGLSPNSIQAQLHLAQWHALLALRTTGGCTTEEAVVAYASHKILANYFPWTETLDSYIGPLLDRQLRQLSLSTAQQRLAQRLGEAVATGVIQRRDPGGQFTQSAIKKALDSAAQPPPSGIFRYFDNEISPGGPAAASFVYSVLTTYKPFVIPNPASFIVQFFPDMKPPVIPSKEWDAYWEELKDIGRIDWPGRTPEMILIANLDACPRVNNNKCQPESRAVATAKSSLPNSTSLYDSVLLLAKISVSMHDASIAQSMFKYGLWFWRPVQAYRAGDSKHAPIPHWTPNVPNPSEPEYLSGAVTSAASGVTPLQHFFGKGKKVAFKMPGGGTFNCPGFVGDPIPSRHYSSLKAFVHEVKLMRTYNGAHFKKALDDAEIMGTAVADYVEKHWAETTPSGVLPDQTFLDLVYTIPKKLGDYNPPRYDLPA